MTDRPLVCAGVEIQDGLLLPGTAQQFRNAARPPGQNVRCLQPDNDSENRLIAHCTVYSGTTCPMQGWILLPYTPTIRTVYTHFWHTPVFPPLGCCRSYAKNYPTPQHNRISFEELSNFYRMSVLDEPFRIDFKLLPNLGYKGIWINWDFFSRIFGRSVMHVDYAEYTPLKPEREVGPTNQLKCWRKEKGYVK